MPSKKRKQNNCELVSQSKISNYFPVKPITISEIKYKKTSKSDINILNSITNLTSPHGLNTKCKESSYNKSARNIPPQHVDTAFLSKNLTYNTIKDFEISESQDKAFTLLHQKEPEILDVYKGGYVYESHHLVENINKFLFFVKNVKVCTEYAIECKILSLYLLECDIDALFITGTTDVLHKKVNELQCILLGNWSYTKVDNYCRLRIVRLNQDRQITPTKSIFNNKCHNFKFQNLIKNLHKDYFVDCNIPSLLFTDDNYSIALVVNPFNLISSTNIVSGISCSRRAILNQRFQSISEPPTFLEAGDGESEGFEDAKDLHKMGEAFNLTYGKWVHKVFQSYIKLFTQKETTDSDDNFRNENILEFSKICNIINSSIDATFLLDVLIHDLNLKEMLNKLKNRISDFANWKVRYLDEKGMILSLPPAFKNNKDINEPYSTKPEKEVGYWIKNLLTEHYLESEVFGLKGFLDVTLILNSTSNSRSDPKSCHPNLLAVLELKTGRVSGSIEHRAQVILYSTLLSHTKTPIPTVLMKSTDYSSCDKGLLLYLDREQKPKSYRSFSNGSKGATFPKHLKTDHENDGDGLTLMPIDTSVPKHLQGLIQTRNELAYYAIPRKLGNHLKGKNGNEIIEALKSDPFLPEITTNTGLCQRCPQLHSCALVSKSFECSGTKKIDIEDCFADDEVDEESIREKAVSHLKHEDLLYFKKWYTLLNIECQASSIENVADDDSSCGQLYRLLLPPVISLNSDEILEDCVLKLTPVPKEYEEPLKTDIPPKFFDKIPYTIGQRLFIKQHMDIHHEIPYKMNGVLKSIDYVKSSPILSIILIKPNLEELKQKLICLNESDSPLFYLSNVENKSNKNVQQLASYTLSAGLGNLAKLMKPGPVYARLRSIIIQPNVEENFGELTPFEEHLIHKNTQNLNEEQRRAIFAALSCPKYVLIKGMPGSGKTETIVKLITVYSILGLTTLVTAHTNSAIDNILLKLSKAGFEDMLRFGSTISKDDNTNEISNKIPTDLQKFCLNSKMIKDLCGIENGVEGCDVRKLEQYITRPSVYAATCFTASRDSLVQKLRYDVCIVDEASQIPQPLTLGPLFACKRFVLVGDSDQLPPIVRSHNARELGAEQSLFSLLESKALLNDTTRLLLYELSMQYRMNRRLMDLSNHALILNGKLKCGNPEIAQMTMSKNIRQNLEGQCPEWIYRALDPDLERSIVFLDVDGRRSDENEGGNRAPTVSIPEVKTVVSIAEALIKRCQVKAYDVGIIALYRDQVDAIKLALAPALGLESFEAEDLEIRTIDQYQGRDKSIVILSFVVNQDISPDRAGDNGSAILRDRRRLNVAFTRARHKLIMVGSRSTLCVRYPMIKSVLNSVLTDSDFVKVDD